MLEKYLQEIGLNEKEAALYLALLQVDNDSVANISKKTKINRSTVYFVLESLEKKGLVSEVRLDKKVHYAAESPERLETFVERQKVVLEEHAARLKDIIPQMKSVQREQGERPIVKFFDGRDGAISAYTEFYEMHDKKTKDGYFVFNRDLLGSVFTQKERAAFIKIRVGKDVFPISLYNDSSGNPVFTGPGERVRLDEKKYPITCDIAIVEDRVIITTLGERVSAILIKSQDIADTLKVLVRKIHNK